MVTPIWRIEEKPEYSVERTPGAWVLWGPCTYGNDCIGEGCAICGGTGETLLETCGVNADLSPTNPDMVTDALGLAVWTPRRDQ